MKPQPVPEVEKHRIIAGPFGTSTSAKNNGQFILPGLKRRSRLLVMVSDGMGWEHVSVSHLDDDLIPSWDDMCYVKDLFWEAEETVIEFHPKKSEYVNNHPGVLHLWKPVGKDIELPPSITVGIKEWTPNQLKSSSK